MFDEAGEDDLLLAAVMRLGAKGGAILNVRAVGRGGLIKQHPADKALAKVTALLPVAG